MEEPDEVSEGPKGNYSGSSSSKDFETLPHTNVNAEDLDEETTSKLRGDAIGDTLYSQSFVLRTLLKFSDLEWNEQVEEDLCFLWDMTAEKSVCEYLWEVSFPSIACSALIKTTENRFIEIVIGTLANIICAGCDRSMTAKDIRTVLMELDTDDHLTLIQIMRFITAVAFTSTQTPFVNEEVMNKLCFVLSNSINTELQLKTLETIAKLTLDLRLNCKFITISLFEDVLASYAAITKSDSDYFQLDTEDSLLACRYMLETVTNICCYLDNFENRILWTEIRDNFHLFLDVAMNIMKYFSQEENLLPVSEYVIFFISAIKYITDYFDTSYLSELFITLSKILCIISGIKDDVMELFESVVEFQCNLISLSTKQKISKDLKLLSKQNANTVIGIVGEYGPKLPFDFDWEDLNSLIK